MGYVPPDAEWFIADLVIAISVEDDPRVVVHVNTTLVRADSAEEAHRKALELGRTHQARYRNAAGRRVAIRFVGLADLDVVHERLEHGAELCFRERRVRSLAAAKAFATGKKRLAVFRPVEPRTGPDYLDGELRRRMERALAPDATVPAGGAKRSAGGAARRPAPRRAGKGITR